jgi:hypothetical protein
MQVGEKRSITVTAACNGNTRSGYRTRGSIYLNGIQKSSSPTVSSLRAGKTLPTTSPANHAA